MKNNTAEQCWSDCRRIQDSNVDATTVQMSEVSSRYTLPPFNSAEEQRRIGRYLAGGTALAVILLALYHVLLRDASTIAGVCVPAIIMMIYVLWILYLVRKDRRKKTARLAIAMRLKEVTSSSDIVYDIK